MSPQTAKAMNTFIKIWFKKNYIANNIAEIAILYIVFIIYNNIYNILYL